MIPKLNVSQLDRLSEILGNLGLVCFGTMVLPLFTKTQIDLFTMLSGLVASILCVIVSITLLKGGGVSWILCKRFISSWLLLSWLLPLLHIQPSKNVLGKNRLFIWFSPSRCLPAQAGNSPGTFDVPSLPSTHFLCYNWISENHLYQACNREIRSLEMSGMACDTGKSQ